MDSITSIMWHKHSRNAHIISQPSNKLWLREVNILFAQTRDLVGILNDTLHLKYCYKRLISMSTSLIISGYNCVYWWTSTLANRINFEFRLCARPAHTRIVDWDSTAGKSPAALYTYFPKSIIHTYFGNHVLPLHLLIQASLNNW